VGLTVEGENSDDGGQKRTEEGRGGSIAGTDMMQARLAMGGGERGREKERRARRRRAALF
jgi:hypothetical protein